jgi:YVTN family beta-propeller protein
MVVSTFFVVSPNFIYAKTLDQLVAEGCLVGQNIPHFKVGSAPSHIASDFGNLLYAVNSGSGIENETISIIHVDSTKVSSIPVGKLPSGITVDLNKDVIYLANAGSNTVSVIHRNDYRIIKNIPVENPEDITFNPFQDKVYVSSLFSGKLTVINGTDYRIIKNIPVSGSPSDITVDGSNIYVASYFFGTGTNGSVTAIYDKTKNVIAGVSLDVHPLNAGSIICKGTKRIDNQCSARN